MRKYIFLALLPFILLGCRIEHSTIPEEYVDFFVYPNSMEYADLNYYGGHVYVTGGVNGIVIYRINEYTFVAYDRACPLDWQEQESWLWMDDSGLLLECSGCHSKFNIINGDVVSGDARHPLKMYKTAYNGNRLRIYN